MSCAWNSGSASDWFIKMHVLDWYKCEDNISKCMAKEIPKERFTFKNTSILHLTKFSYCLVNSGLLFLLFSFHVTGKNRRQNKVKVWLGLLALLDRKQMFGIV